MKQLTLVLLCLFLSFAGYGIWPITGGSTVCTGQYAMLADATPGGTWSSSNASIASIGTTGIVTGVATGTATITYTVGAGYVTFAITTILSPAPMTAPDYLCPGSTVTITDITPGGRWTSNNTYTATVDSVTGTEYARNPGPVIITYTAGNGCRTTKQQSVAPTVAISGITGLCLGGTSVLSQPYAGGSWISSNVSVAAIGTYTGLVTSVSVGTSIVSYSYSYPYTGALTCYSTVNVTVVNATMPITGPPDICTNNFTTFTDIPGGGTWSSSNPSVLPIDPVSGSVISSVPGTATITYSGGACGTVTTSVSVLQSPMHINGEFGYIGYGYPIEACAGMTITLTDSTAGGTWSSSDTSIATIGATSGILHFTGSGHPTITYTAGNGCRVTRQGSVMPRPTIGGFYNICPGTDLTLASTFFWGGPGPGLWTSSNTSVALIGSSTGRLTGVALGSTTITFSSIDYVCTTDTTITIGSNKIDNHMVIYNPDTMCSGPDFYISACGISPNFKVTTFFGDGTADTTALSSAVYPFHADVIHNYSAPGTYSIKQILLDSISRIDSTTFSYDYNYCRTLPFKFYYDHNSNCVNDSGDLPIFLPGLIAIDSNGIPIDTISATSGLYYKAVGPPGTVYAFRIISTIYDWSVTCPSTNVIYDTIQSYVNTYPTKYFALFSASGSIFDLSTHTTLTCGRHRAEGIITVNNNLSLPQNGLATLNFSPKYDSIDAYPNPDAISGNTAQWNLSALSSVSSPVTIYFRLHVRDEWAPGYSTWLIPGDTANSSISITPIAGDLDTTNNIQIRCDTIRSSYDPNEIIVSPQGKILPCSQQQYTVRFENTGNDTAHNIYVMDTLSANVDLHSLRLVSATAAMNIALLTDGGYNVVKFDFPGINLLDSSHHNECDGMVIYTVKTRPGVSDGDTVSNYAGIYFDDNPAIMTNTAINTIGINPITGPDTVCIGFPISLNNATPGGTWSSSNSLATLSVGVVSGVSNGKDTIQYRVSNECGSRTASKVITIISSKAGIAPITGITNVCAGASTRLNSNTPNGVWSSSNPAIASIDASGLVTAIAASSSTITYSVPVAGCPLIPVTTSVTVNALPTVFPVAKNDVYYANEKGAPIVLQGSQTGVMYQLFNGNAPASGSLPGTGAAIDFGLVTVGEYNIQAINTNTFCSSTMADDIVVVTANDAELSISPNPTRSKLLINADIRIYNYYTVTNEAGQKVMADRISASRITLDVKSLGSGVYFVEFQGSKGNKRLKFVKL